MPWSDPELEAEYYTINGTGPQAQTSIPQTIAPNTPTTILTAGTFNTSAIISNGYKVIAVGVTSSGTGALNIQRYLDREGTIPVTAVSTTPLVAATPLVVVVNSGTDGIPFASFSIVITNTSGGTVTITKFFCLLQAS